MAPYVSIIIPIYKVPEKVLRKCIESTINQTLRNIEILLIDDGSPDNCGLICDEYSKIDGRVKVIHKNNGGLSAARNIGFINATGKWFMFVDGDDWIENNMCELMYNIGEEKNVELVMCGFYKDYSRISHKYKSQLRDGKVYRDHECKWLQQQLLVFNGNISSAFCKLINREFANDNKLLHDEILKQGAEALEYNLRLFEKIKSAIYIDKPLYHYTYNESSITSSYSEENNRYVIECFKKIKNLIDISENKEQLLPWFYNRLDYVIITTAISGYFNPDNMEPFSVKKKKYSEYLEQPIIKEAFNNKMLSGLSLKRRIVLYLIKKEKFLLLDLIAKIRRFQKKIC